MRGAVTVLAAALVSCAAAKSPSPSSSPLPPQAQASAPAKVEGHLAHAICAGAPRKDPPRPPPKATCCYPAKELLVRPIRAAYPALRQCFDARSKRDAEGRVAFTFRIEQDGSIAHVCAGEGSAMDDEPAIRCMVEEMRKVRFASMTDEERDFCGLITMTYPVVFAP